MMRGARSILAFVLLAACASSSDRHERPLPSAVASPLDTPSVPALPATASVGAPLTGRPRIVIENHASADIKLYGAYIVDETGKLGTLSLWPHATSCPAYEPKERLLPAGGTHELAPPTHAYDEKKCTEGPALPPGRYHVHIGSGYTDELYAGGPITLPLTEPVRLEMRARDEPPDCTPARAQRAARLTLRDAKRAGVSDAVLRACDPMSAGCGTLPLPEDLPPRKCTLTLHENHFRIRPAPGPGVPAQITAWLDGDLVFAQRAEVSHSTGAELFFGKDRVVLEGITRRHLHEHGGKAATIGSMQIRVSNGTRRSLKVKALAAAFLSDGSCGVPKEGGPAIAVTGLEPKELPPGESELDVQFSPSSAYQAHCDLFASRAQLQIEGKTIEVTSEHEVTRIEPLRR
jgi:hypothetical protein